jgi:hypothetical protein
MLHHKANWLREVSIDYSSWNAGDASQLPDRREWTMLKGIKNCLVNNDHR